ncbi:O-antigen ligase family protein [Polynucleobacter sp. MWH-HuK1]|uniref:O-antigen ligase family protein n=1 Tax=Polynucleobacter sp. MWH-HuK1 TaxID=1743158 RepID=UPI001C0ACB84|nr:O-antigen ligase family protein [Polynucleobacter sp. MWH-HuK1]MBU3564476.1 O-antigen ligase family protein [Polynucleobacter sp. MWH-HuK1]
MIKAFSSTTKSVLATAETLPPMLIAALCWLFAILFGIWMLPNTIFVRNACLLLGGLLGLYVIALELRRGVTVLQVNAIPVLMVMLLYLWVTAHLLWLGAEPQLQLQEFSRYWKRIILCFPFALGLGLALRSAVVYSDTQQSKNSQSCWGVMYLGLMLPTIIFFVKYALTILAKHYQIELNPFLEVSEDYHLSRFGMSKAWYVFFCLPGFAVALGMITNAILTNTFTIKKYGVFLLSMIAVLCAFYLQAVRNGMIYAGILIVIAIAIAGRSVLRSGSRKQIAALFAISLILAAMVAASVHKHPQWKMMVADAKVAVQLEKFDHWKYQNHLGKGYPMNEYGKAVNLSNYERVAWGIVGTKLLIENPQGYGLMSLSFDHLTKAKWPDSWLSMTHSGWLDFALGYGIPGLALLLGALLLAWHNSKKVITPWSYLGRWGLGSIGLLMITTELSSEIFINATVFMVVAIAGMTMDLGHNKKLDKHLAQS